MQLGFITSNKGKVLELIERLSPLGHNVVQLAISYPELQADSIEEVATFGLELLQAKIKNNLIEQDHINNLDMIFLEDSGIFVHALHDFPGVYSKFVFTTIGYNGVLELLKNQTERTARFESCIAVLRLKPKTDKDVELTCTPEEVIHIFKGVCSGDVVDEPRGILGFGYDPIFQPQGATRTFAEMETEEKNKYSHRGKAMQKFVEFLDSY